MFAKMTRGTMKSGTDSKSQSLLDSQYDPDVKTDIIICPVVENMDDFFRFKCCNGDYNIANNSLHRLPHGFRNINFHELEVTTFEMEQLIEYLLTDKVSLYSVSKTLVKCGLLDFVKETLPMRPHEDKEGLYDWIVGKGLGINVQTERGFEIGSYFDTRLTSLVFANHLLF